MFAYLYRLEVEEDGVGDRTFGEVDKTAEGREVLDRHDPG